MSVEVIGVIAGILGTLMFISPLSQIKKIIVTKNSKPVSPLLFFTMTLNCLSWLLYGFSIGSIFLIIPNTIGAICSFLTLVIIFKYR